MQAGDAIVGVNGEAVQSIEDVSKALANSAERSSVVLNILHGGVIYGLTYPMGHANLVSHLLGVQLSKAETLTEWRDRVQGPLGQWYPAELRAHRRSRRDR